MADSSGEALRQIMANCQVQDTFSDAILEQGWTVDHFAMMDFETDIMEVLGSTESTSSISKSCPEMGMGEVPTVS